MHSKLHINEHLSAKCLTNRDETCWEAREMLGNSKRAGKHHLAGCTCLDKEGSLREEAA